MLTAKNSIQFAIQCTVLGAAALHHTQRKAPVDAQLAALVTGGLIGFAGAIGIGSFLLGRQNRAIEAQTKRVRYLTGEQPRI